MHENVLVTTSTTADQRASGDLIDPRLFTEVDGERRLAGSRCEQCREITFPASAACAACGSDQTQPLALSTRGTLWNFTTQGFAPKAPYIGPADPETFEPYGLGYVELPEGVIVQTLLTEADPARLSIGMTMELVEWKLDVPSTGGHVVTYAFKPEE